MGLLRRQNEIAERVALATLRLDGVSHVHFAKRMREHGAGVRRGGFQFDLMIARHVAVATKHSAIAGVAKENTYQLVVKYPLRGRYGI